MKKIHIIILFYKKLFTKLMTFYTSPDRFPLYHLDPHIYTCQPAFSRLNFNADHQKNPKTLS